MWDILAELITRVPTRVTEERYLFRQKLTAVIVPYEPPLTDVGLLEA